MTEPDPAARRLADKMREDIQSGALREGTKLPSIAKLAEEHGIGRGATEHALSILRGEGWVMSRRGSGFYVAKQFARIRRVSPDRLDPKLRAQGKMIQDHDTGDRWRAVNPLVADVVPPPDVAEALGVEPGTVVLSRLRRFKVDGRFVQLSVSYLPTDLTRGTRIEHSSPGPGGIHGVLAELGYEPTRYEERLIGRAPRPTEVEGLELRSVGAMVLEITRLAWSGERCVEVNRMVLDAEAYEVVYKFPAP
ncbi:GntR family transcriptional regulator [Micromonospora sp. WMMD1102]|uniref:GntR family transcriptional regulator n=1 Tax=Micromonospora sp. WMMD1102 TaxID=3016105 RepID=UPI0024156C72|nr:GntR family transcriptional regulator [Micromonospora sp. WMMD1102]MDG4792084.1 GntR family transcriptional regulator [Micromonospora sp. WMMD1102]